MWMLMDCEWFRRELQPGPRYLQSKFLERRIHPSPRLVKSIGLIEPQTGLARHQPGLEAM
jgi:hypothetical protein